MKKARTLRALSGRSIKREEVGERSKPYAARTSGTLSKASEIELYIKRTVMQLCSYSDAVQGTTGKYSAARPRS
jgi:hypothetical protein